MNKFVHLIIICLLIQINSQAQIPGLTQFTTNNGLASNTVYDTTQDSDGFMWFATDYGVSKFDGLTFKNFTISDGLPGNEILSFFKDSKDRIWMIAFNGSIGYIKNGKLFNNLNTPYLSKLKFQSFISDIFEDSKGQLWFCKGANNIKVLKSDLSIKEFHFKNKYKSKQFPIITEDLNNDIKIIAYNKRGLKSSIISQPENTVDSLLIWNDFNPKKFNSTTKNKIYKNLGGFIRNKNYTVEKISSYYNENLNYFLTNIYNIDDDYWVTNLNNGVLIFNKSNNYSSPKLILKNVLTTRAFEDLENNIWVGSKSNGVYLFPNIHINGFQFEDKNKNDLHSISIFNDQIVVGNEKGELILLNKKSLETTKTFKLDFRPNRIRKLKIKDQNLYILSDFNLHKLSSDYKIKRIKNMFNSELFNTQIKNFKDLTFDNTHIITANASGIAKINLNTNVPEQIWNKRTSAILNVDKNNLWIGTTSGLYNYNGTSTSQLNLCYQLDNSIIYALQNSKHGLLIGSNSYGIGVLKDNKCSLITKDDGLLSNYIKSISIDDQNNIWLSTNFGLNCLSLTDDNKIKFIKSYTTSDGLYSNDVRASIVNDNKVYVATSKGLNIIDLSQEVTSISTPNVHITEVLLNNKEIDKTDGQTFNNQLNNAQFNFSGISFKSLGNITFQYRLKGLETEWISTKTNTVRYSALPPNNYTFELKAISKNKLVSAPALFSFIIKPPFFKTWWFIAGCFLILIAIIALIFYLRSLKVIRKQKTKEQILNLRYQALNAQMNPHFINNLLVNINGLADKGEINEVKGSLDKFAELVNLILKSTKSNLITLKEELEMASLYLELQKLRFNKKITYSINTDSFSQQELESIFVPPMILQPIIENSFKHGFKSGDKTNEIIVNLNIKNNEFLICEITDNGKGIQHKNIELNSTSSGISFSNINERLQLINESDHHEEFVLISNITDEFNTLVGLKVTLKIPLISF